jgi:hypothetical protein
MLDDLHRHKPRSVNGGSAKDPFAPIPSFVNTGVIWIEEAKRRSIHPCFRDACWEAN